MRVNGRWMRTIWEEDDAVCVIDQRALPHHVEILKLHTFEDVAHAISDMAVRGAGLIGASAAWGMVLAARNYAKCGSVSEFDDCMRSAAKKLISTRPTASNLAYAVRRVIHAMSGLESVSAKISAAHITAVGIADEDASFCKRIGINGLEIIRSIYKDRVSRGVSPTVEILTHCNAGWLAFVDFGSALAPVYAAVREGIPVHVWVDETRPRGQGASLTAFELSSGGIPHDVIADNAGGHLMQHGFIDMVIVGADRVTRRGDAANKIGTYLKALAAYDNHIPFYVAFPSSTFDFSMSDGVKEIPVEERSPDEVRYAVGRLDDGSIGRVRLCPEQSPARNFGFDVTPARFITRLITERGVIRADEKSIGSLFSEAEHYRVDGQEHIDDERKPSCSASDGVVKFVADHVVVQLDKELEPIALQLDNARHRLHCEKLIGELNGIGYGNISCRIPHEFGSFLISGTSTGCFGHLDAQKWAVVDASMPWENALMSHGGTCPSSESMTHAAIYAVRPDVAYVAHIHSRKMFDALLRTECPRTSVDVPYGTPEMAFAVAELVQSLPTEGLFVAAGHQDGVFVFGSSAESIVQRLSALNRELTNASK